MDWATLLDTLLQREHGPTLEWFLKDRRDRPAREVADELGELTGHRPSTRTVFRLYERFGIDKKDARRSA